MRLSGYIVNINKQQRQKAQTQTRERQLEDVGELTNLDQSRCPNRQQANTQSHTHIQTVTHTFKHMSLWTLLPCDLRQLRPSTTLYNALWHNKLESCEQLSKCLLALTGHACPAPFRATPTRIVVVVLCHVMKRFGFLFTSTLSQYEGPFINGSLKGAAPCRLVFLRTYSKVSFVLPSSSPTTLDMAIYSDGFVWQVGHGKTICKR